MMEPPVRYIIGFLLPYIVITSAHHEEVGSKWPIQGKRSQCLSKHELAKPFARVLSFTLVNSNIHLFRAFSGVSCFPNEHRLIPMTFFPGEYSLERLMHRVDKFNSIPQSIPSDLCNRNYVYTLIGLSSILMAYGNNELLVIMSF